MLSEETKPLIEKMEEFLQKNPEEAALKGKLEEAVKGIKQVILFGSLYKLFKQSDKV